MSLFKKFLPFALAGVTTLSLLTGCSQQSWGNQSQSQSQASSENISSSQPANSPASEVPPASSESTLVPEEPEGGKTLVVYFSASGNTRAVAETIIGHIDADSYELVPVEPYTDADLNWRNPDSRVNAEHNDPSHRTAIAGELPDLAAYDIIFVGYPLWWREAPSIVWNWVENADLSGKTMIPFCTSTTNGIEDSVETLRGMAPAADWQEGHRFGENLDTAAVTAWMDSLALPDKPEAPAEPAADATATGSSNALVIYFSVPEDVDTTGVDAIAGASVLVSNNTALGNMEYMAQIIQRETGADSYRIVEQNTYPKDHQPLLDLAQQEQRNNDRPAISAQLPDLSGYDVIYLGYPKCFPHFWG